MVKNKASQSQHDLINVAEDIKGIKEEIEVQRSLQEEYEENIKTL